MTIEPYHELRMAGNDGVKLPFVDGIDDVAGGFLRWDNEPGRDAVFPVGPKDAVVAYATDLAGHESGLNARHGDAFFREFVRDGFGESIDGKFARTIGR